MESSILIILFIIPGVWSGNWGVTSTDQCALKGTSVLIKCEYDYPSGLVVTGVAWYQRQRISGLVHLSKIRSAPDHFRYVGNKWSNCSLRINDVQSSDAREYYFQFKTTLNNKWLSQRPALLTVTELTAFVEPSTVTEGDCVNLACVSGCPSHVDVVWFKDGQPVANPIFQARREDAGRYYCAVQGQEMIRSASVALNVQYAPRKVSLSVSPSSEVLKGSAVTFTCSSDANPTVTHNGYSLHKDGHLISSGANHSISDIQPSYSGLFWCQAWNNISRRAVDLINSTAVHLDVQYPPVNISVSMDPPHVTEGSSVNLTCSSSANPAVQNYTWFRRTASPSSGSSSIFQVGSGQVLSLPSMEVNHTGLYLCQARNTVGETNSTEVLLTISAKNHGGQSVLFLAGVGVFLFIALVLTVFFFWRKKTNYTVKKLSNIS
ncbi:B-cell receptor CD22 [Labrus bergylta]|uniref:B-cell receptor CD22 n=1 Tax=Labrus bergylta TaxID=56723 RepID=UPI0009B3C7F3|nr:B-cell receptor CD22-like [Labrus bergylta]